MSMKAVEMQFALHKNEDAGFKQQQMMNKPVQDQAALSQESEKQLLEQRRISSKTDETSRMAADRDGGYGGKQDKNPSGAKKRGQAGTDSASPPPHDGHPYKGHHIDISL
ncbi:hypothetical protein [Paenibacillus puerhi]|uniref:hypothetical protein n=1 Tax=Paenibacillus puerhi TaxID=2692622 RepID=UPI001358039C|nr:hypothetical protein [Paenibacillus puerhi]